MELELELVTKVRVGLLGLCTEYKKGGWWE